MQPINPPAPVAQHLEGAPTHEAPIARARKAISPKPPPGMPIARAQAAHGAARLGVAGAGWIARSRSRWRFMLLMPLKRVEPFVIRVDNATGSWMWCRCTRATRRCPKRSRAISSTHYVTVCERFNFATAESDYEECGAFHTAQRNQAWYALWNPNNPAIAVESLQGRHDVRAQVTSVSFFKRANGVRDLAQVRYVKAKRQPGSANEETTHWIATLQYAYADPSTDPRCGAGTRSDSRSWISGPSRKCCTEPPPAAARSLRPLTEALNGGRRESPNDRWPVFALTARRRLRRDRAVAGAPRPADPHRPPTVRIRCIGSKGFVGYQTDLEFETGETFVGLGAGDIEGISFVAAGQSPLPEAQGREGRHESHHPDHAPHLLGRLFRDRRASGCDRGGHVRRALHLPAAPKDGREREQPRARARRRTEPTQHRLLVLRRFLDCSRPRPPMTACTRASPSRPRPSSRRSSS